MIQPTKSNSRQINRFGHQIWYAYPLGTISEAETGQIRETVQKVKEVEQHRVRTDLRDPILSFKRSLPRQRTRFQKHMCDTICEEAAGAPLDLEKPNNVKPPTESYR